mgnify:CR=1 FL=1
MRNPYLDNIRWVTVIIVLVYHVFYLFNNIGVPGAIANQAGIKQFDVLLYFVYPWFMVLMFLIAGISARYSLQKRSGKHFISERVAKLIVPSTLGLFVYHWISGYLNIKIGGGLAFIPKALIYPISAIAGIGPLWFAQTLFLFSVLLILIRKVDRKDKLWMLGKRVNIIALLLLVFPIWGMAQVLNLPLLTMYRFGIYGFAFLLGYFIFSHDAVQEAVEKIHIPMFIIVIPLGVVYVVCYFGTDYTSAQCLQSFFTNVYLWIAVLAILGCGKAWFNGSTRFSKYMTKSSFGFYIVHYPIIMVTCYLLHYYCNLPIILNYVAALVVEFVLTPVLYEIFRRIPVIRYLVLGIRKKRVK